MFLWTLSRVINSFITRDKALRGTLCYSTLFEKCIFLVSTSSNMGLFLYLCAIFAKNM